MVTTDHPMPVDSNENDNSVNNCECHEWYDSEEEYNDNALNTMNDILQIYGNYSTFYRGALDSANPDSEVQCL